jgi:hypothetical protein
LPEREAGQAVKAVLDAAGLAYELRNNRPYAIGVTMVDPPKLIEAEAEAA